jgi:photosystem II stability/assembly factor-like uncharacterized protein
MIRAIQPTKALFATENPPHAVVLANTAEGLWFFGSQQWVELEGQHITAIAPHDTGIWAIVNQTELWHRPLTGEWQLVSPGNQLQLNCLLPIDHHTVLVGTADAHLLRVKNGTIEPLESFEAAPGREEWYTPWGGSPDVRSMALGTSGEIYVNVHVGGILRSDDQGRSWLPTVDIDVDVHQVQTVPSYPNWVLAATAQGFAISTDRGETWQFDRTNLHGRYARAIAISDDIILMSVSTGPNTSKAALYRRPLSLSAPFVKCEQGLPTWFPHNINTACLTSFQGKTIFGTEEGQLFASEDAGETWHEVISGLPAIQGVSIVPSLH